MAQVRWPRVMLKLSGEAMAGGRGLGFDVAAIDAIAREVGEAKATGAEIAIMVGGGNIMRGARTAEADRDRSAADSIGMLATVQNGLALQEALERQGHDTRLQSAITMSAVAEPFIRRRAIRHLEKGRIVILSAGTGNPYFSTDTAAALRALEVRAQAVLKATNVDGIYDRDPHKHPDARRYRRLTYDQCIEQKLGVMDLTAFTLCAENDLPVVVFDLGAPGNVRRAVLGEDVGTVVGREP